MSRVLSALSTTILIFLGSLLFTFVILNLLGLRPMYVVSGSMEPAFYRGDLLIKSDSSLLPPKEGDIIAFKAHWLDDKIVTHRLLSLSEDKIITKGDNNTQVDPPESSESIVGVIVTKVPYLGWLIAPWSIRGLTIGLFLILLVEFYLKKKRKPVIIPHQINSMNSPSIVYLLDKQ